MFYNYDLSVDSPSTVNRSIALSTFSNTAYAATTRKGPNLLALSAIDAQWVCGQPGDPFSGDFTGDFGGGVSYVLVTVNKFIKASSAQAAHRVSTTFHLNTQALSAASAEAARVVMKHLAFMLPSVASSESANLTYVRPWHVVVAAKSSQAGRLIKAVTKTTFHVTSAQVVTSARALGHLINIASGEAVALLKGSGLQRSVTDAQASALLKTPIKPFAVASADVAAVAPRAIGRALKAASIQAVAIVRGLPWHIAVTSTENPRISFGNNVYQRVFAAVSGEAAALQRGLAVLRGALSPDTAGIVRTPARSLGTVDAQAVSFLKTPGLPRGVGAGQAFNVVRQIAVLRGAVSASTSALTKGALHLLAAFTATDPQAVAVFTQHVIGRSLSLPHPQASSVAFSALRTLLRSLSVASPQALAIARTMSKLASAVSGAAQALVRVSARSLAVAASNVAALLAPALHFIIRGIASPEAIGKQASHSVQHGTGSAESTALVHIHGAFLGAIQANAAAMQRALVKLIGMASTQAITVGRAIGRSLVAVSSQVAALTNGSARLFSTASAEIAAIITRRGSRVSTVTNTQVAALRNLVAKLAMTFSPQTSSGGRGDTKLIGTASPSAVNLVRPRGFKLQVGQGQSLRTISYYHFFVAPWAYQQTSLLPPSGGVAEPPSFGPIDPADQTIFAFDWSSRAYPNDTILSATVTSVPPGLAFLTTPYVSNNLVEVTVPPFTAPVLPTTYSLRCTAKFSSGRISSFSIPVPVRTL